MNGKSGKNLAICSQRRIMSQEQTKCFWHILAFSAPQVLQPLLDMDGKSSETHSLYSTAFPQSGRNKGVSPYRSRTSRSVGPATSARLERESGKNLELAVNSVISVRNKRSVFARLNLHPLPRRFCNLCWTRTGRAARTQALQSTASYQSKTKQSVFARLDLSNLPRRFCNLCSICTGKSGKNLNLAVNGVIPVRNNQGVFMTCLILPRRFCNLCST